MEPNKQRHKKTTRKKNEVDKKQRLTRENQGSGKEDREKEKMRLRGQSLLFVSTRLGDKEKKGDPFLMIVVIRERFDYCVANMTPVVQIHADKTTRFWGVLV